MAPSQEESMDPIARADGVEATGRQRAAAMARINVLTCKQPIDIIVIVTVFTPPPGG
jgi:hypothetical protein